MIMSLSHLSLISFWAKGLWISAKNLGWLGSFRWLTLHRASGYITPTLPPERTRKRLRFFFVGRTVLLYGDPDHRLGIWKCTSWIMLILLSSTNIWIVCNLACRDFQQNTWVARMDPMSILSSDPFSCWLGGCYRDCTPPHEVQGMVIQQFFILRISLRTLLTCSEGRF